MHFICRQKPIEAGSKEENLSPLTVKFLDEEGNEVDPQVPRDIGSKTNLQFELNAGDSMFTQHIRDFSKFKICRICLIIRHRLSDA